FHAQPNACGACGPTLEYSNGAESSDALQSAVYDIKQGKIVAIKGLGGYHLCVDAFNFSAVELLRERKNREEKPFAVMMSDLETVEEYCHLSESEKRLLSSSKKPIVLLKKREKGLFDSVSPNNNSLGVMLPYTPLHALLMKHFECLGFTSANISDSPMIYEESTVLSLIADGVLSHNRKIKRRVDDSVMVVVNDIPHFFRRARGYAPAPIPIDCDKNILALGAQQKNTFCITKSNKAFLSSHLGELDDLDTIIEFKSEINSFCTLFGVKPKLIACDMHPDYFSSQYADSFDLPVVQVQHHHAHFASVLAENCIDRSIFGFIFDGTGYGTDGSIWGGEMLFGQVSDSKRIGHLRQFPLLGGEAAIKQPWRIGLGLLEIAFGKDMTSYFPKHINESKILLNAYSKGINSPLTSSMGRLFDGIAAIINLRTECSYEGQAAIELEQIMCDESVSAYSFEIVLENDIMVFDWRGLVRNVVYDIENGVSKAIIAKKFHNACIDLVVDAAKIAFEKYGISEVALSGGVFMNVYLLRNCQKRLEQAGFTCYVNTLVPTNDGGISYGQAAVASKFIKDGELCVLQSQEE
ncbi:MAG: carbamoyltransferase HypF, partial [Clostridiales bacterium]|nr:carbamoyltransferase HypF [Clostridiales bacterium]